MTTRAEYLAAIRDGKQLNREALDMLTPEDINAAHKAGSLEYLMKGIAPEPEPEPEPTKNYLKEDED